MKPYNGMKVILNTLLKEGDFPGEIIDCKLYNMGISKTVVVKLGCQEKPVQSVLYYENEPEVINSSLWQICWPVNET
jgi:hypothetical protein